MNCTQLACPGNGMSCQLSLAGMAENATSHGQVEAPQAVAREGVGSTLQHNCGWTIEFHDFVNRLNSTSASICGTGRWRIPYRLKDILVRFIGDTIP